MKIFSSAFERQRDAHFAPRFDGAGKALAALQLDGITQLSHLSYSFTTSNSISAAAVCGEETCSTALPVRPVVRR